MIVCTSIYRFWHWACNCRKLTSSGKVLIFYNVAPTQLTPSVWRVILGYEALCAYSLEYFSSFYTMKKLSMRLAPLLRRKAGANWLLISLIATTGGAPPSFEFSVLGRPQKRVIVGAFRRPSLRGPLPRVLNYPWKTSWNGRIDCSILITTVATGANCWTS